MFVPNQPVALTQLLSAYVVEQGLKPKMDAARAVEGWAMVAGPRICAQTESVRLRGDVLTVRITSAAWRHTLHMQRTAWRDRLNDHLGEAVVEAIEFR